MPSLISATSTATSRRLVATAALLYHLVRARTLAFYIAALTRLITDRRRTLAPRHTRHAEYVRTCAVVSLVVHLLTFSFADLILKHRQA